MALGCFGSVGHGIDYEAQLAHASRHVPEGVWPDASADNGLFMVPVLTSSTPGASEPETGFKPSWATHCQASPPKVFGELESDVVFMVISSAACHVVKKLKSSPAASSN